MLKWKIIVLPFVTPSMFSTNSKQIPPLGHKFPVTPLKFAFRVEGISIPLRCLSRTLQWLITVDASFQLHLKLISGYRQWPFFTAPRTQRTPGCTSSDTLLFLLLFLQLSNIYLWPAHLPTTTTLLSEATRRNCAICWRKLTYALFSSLKSFTIFSSLSFSFSVWVACSVCTCVCVQLAVCWIRRCVCVFMCLLISNGKVAKVCVLS